MPKASVKVTKMSKRTVTRTRVGKSRNKQKGNPNKCHVDYTIIMGLDVEDVNAIQSVQDKYHEKYKKKYNDRFTTKNNYRQVPMYPQYDGEEERRTRRIGFEY